MTTERASTWNTCRALAIIWAFTPKCRPTTTRATRHTPSFFEKTIRIADDPAVERVAEDVAAIHRPRERQRAFAEDDLHRTGERGIGVDDEVRVRATEARQNQRPTLHARPFRSEPAANLPLLVRHDASLFASRRRAKRHCAAAKFPGSVADGARPWPEPTYQIAGSGQMTLATTAPNTTCPTGTVAMARQSEGRSALAVAPQAQVSA